MRTHAAKVTAWVIGACFLGAAGGIYGNLVRFIDPTQMAFAGATIGVWMILMALLGGKGTLAGPIVSAILFQLTKENKAERIERSGGDKHGEQRRRPRLDWEHGDEAAEHDELGLAHIDDVGHAPDERHAVGGKREHGADQDATFSGSRLCARSKASA